MTNSYNLSDTWWNVAKTFEGVMVSCWTYGQELVVREGSESIWWKGQVTGKNRIMWKCQFCRNDALIHGGATMRTASLMSCMVATDVLCVLIHRIC